MARQQFVESLIGALGLGQIAAARHDAGIGIHNAQRRLLGLIDDLDALHRLGLLAVEVEHQSRMIIAEQAKTVITQLVDRLDRTLGIIGTEIGPARQQGRRNVALTSAATVGERRPRGLIALGLHGLGAKHKMGEAVFGVALDHAVSEKTCIIHIAIGQCRNKGAFQQFAIAWIEPQRLAEIGCGRRCVALGTGREGGEIIAR